MGASEPAGEILREAKDLLRRLVDLVGIEPTTSSMPWKRAPKLRHRPTLCDLLLYSR